MRKLDSAPMKRGGTTPHAKATCPQINLQRALRKRKQCNKPDPDTSSWLETFLITNSCLWVTRPTARHKAAQQLSVSLVLHFQGRASSQCSVHEHPGLLCKSNKSFKIGPTHPFPALITFISSVICPFPYICTQRSFLTFCFAVVSVDCAVTYALNIFAKTVVPDFSLTRRQTRYDGKRGYLVKAVVFWPTHIICETYHSFQKKTKKQKTKTQTEKSALDFTMLTMLCWNKKKVRFMATLPFFSSKLDHLSLTCFLGSWYKLHCTFGNLKVYIFALTSFILSNFNFWLRAFCPCSLPLY